MTSLKKTVSRNVSAKRARPIKKVNVTFSIPHELNERLHSLVPSGGLSEFATTALEVAIRQAEGSLETEYREAFQDPDRVNLVREWQEFDWESWDDKK